MLKKVPREIKDFEEQVIAFFTKRQIIFAILILLISLPISIVVSIYINDDLGGWTFVIITIFIGGCIFGKINGMRLREFIPYFIKYTWVNPKIRKCTHKNYYEYIISEEEKSNGKLKKNNNI